MRKNNRFFLIIIIFTLAAVFFLFSILAEGLHIKRVYRIQEIRFRLPIPGDLVVKYGIQTEESVQKVYLSGPFCGWNPSHPAYEMAGREKGEWVISLPFEAGRTPYKFAVYLQGRSAPVWVHDADAKEQENDGMGGFNSVMINPAGYNFAIIGWILFWGAVFILLTALYQALYYGKFSIWKKLVLSFVISVVFICFSGIRVIKPLADRSIREFLEMRLEPVILELEERLSSGDSPATVENRAEISRIFNFALWNDINRNDTDFYTKKFGYFSLMLFDEKEHIYSFVYRSDKTPSWISADSWQTQMYLKKNAFAPVFDRIKTEKIGILHRWIPVFRSRLFEQRPVLIRFGAFFQEIVVYLIPVGVYRSETVYAALFSIPTFRYSFYFYLFLLLLLNLGVHLMIGAGLFFKKKTPLLKNLTLDESRLVRFNITVREKEILEHLLKGEQNKEIAHTLSISKKTVDNHLSHLFQKTGARNRIELSNLFRKDSSSPH